MFEGFTTCQISLPLWVMCSTSHLKSTHWREGCFLHYVQPGKPTKLILTAEKAVTWDGNNWPRSSPERTSPGATGNQKLNINPGSCNDSKGTQDVRTRAELLRHGQLSIRSVQHQQGCWAMYSTGTWFHGSKLMVWMTRNLESTI